MRAFLERADDFLRANLHPVELPVPGEVGHRLLRAICTGGLGYGAVMGAFGGVWGEPFRQIVYSAVKLPVLLLGTFFICLPSFFVLNTLAGLRSDFGQALRALLATQAGMSLVLCSCAPLTALWYCSVANYHAAILFNGLLFATASLAAQTILRRLYRPLVERNARHRLLLRVWLGLYVFVGIQLGWVLRPFVGRPGFAVEFFRESAWGNAYVEVFHHLTGLVGG